jgi:hypothetical protein
MFAEIEVKMFDKDQTAPKNCPRAVAAASAVVIPCGHASEVPRTSAAGPIKAAGSQAGGLSKANPPQP